jgi:hypothetical protein
MKTCRAVALHDKAMAFVFGELGRRLGRFRKTPLTLIFFQGHGNILKKAEERSRMRQEFRGHKKADLPPRAGRVYLCAKQEPLTF